MNAEQTRSLLFKFVSHSRENISYPFSQQLTIGKYLCATNGTSVCLIAQTKENTGEIIENKKSPTLQTILPQFTDDITIQVEQLVNLYKSIPMITRQRTMECKVCDGKGKFHHYNHTYDCQECDETGIMKMHGNETIRNPDTLFKFGDLLIAIDRIELLNSVLSRVKPTLEEALANTFKIVKLAKHMIWFNCDDILIGIASKIIDEDDETKYNIVEINF